MIKELYAILDIPWVYRLSQIILAPGKPWLFKRLCDRVFAGSQGKILDVGCGPKLVTPKPQGLLVGVDVNEAFLREYTGGFLDKDPALVINPSPSREKLGYLAPVDHMPFADGSFDQVRAVGFLHHLPDDELARGIREMDRCLKKGGRFVVLEDVWPRRAWARPIAWVIRRLDRGEFMRTQEELLELFQKACPGKWEWERCNYTFIGSELLYLNRVKE